MSALTQFPINNVNANTDHLHNFPFNIIDNMNFEIYESGNDGIDLDDNFNHLKPSCSHLFVDEFDKQYTMSDENLNIISYNVSSV